MSDLLSNIISPQIMSDKNSLRQTILKQLQINVEKATQAADAAKETATSDETVAENKYDTFGLEASYLAHGQSKRAAEILKAIDRYRSLPFKTFNEDDPIGLTAIVSLENDNGETRHFFIGPDAGGLEFRFNFSVCTDTNVETDTDTMMIITPQTPMGRQLIGSTVGDSVTLLVNGQMTTYDIVDVS